MNKWISVEDRLPEPSESISYLVWVDGRPDYVGYWQLSYFNYEDGDEPEWDYLDVTHWMPLPEPPENDNE